MHTGFLTLISVSLFYFCGMVFTHVNTWMIEQKFNETSLTEKERLSLLNMEDIADADYTHADGACKDFEIKKFRRIR